MCSVTKTRPALKPLSVTGRWLLKPVAPCELLPRGMPGVLLVNERPYLATIIGELPDEGEPVVRGYRLTKDGGETYEIDTNTSWGQWECSCPDSVYRGNRPGGCKHVAALRQAQATPTPPAARVSAVA